MNIKYSLLGTQAMDKHEVTALCKEPSLPEPCRNRIPRE